MNISILEHFPRLTFKVKGDNGVDFFIYNYVDYVTGDGHGDDSNNVSAHDDSGDDNDHNYGHDDNGSDTNEHIDDTDNNEEDAEPRHIRKN